MTLPRWKTNRRAKPSSLTSAGLRLVWLLFPLLLLAAGGCGAPRPPGAAAGPAATRLGRLRQTNPKLSGCWIWLDLKDPRICVRVAPGGPASSPPGPWVTTLLPPSEVARRDHVDAAINGDFFAAERTTDVEGRRTGYLRGKPAFPVGAAMTDGRLWHRSDQPRPCLEITSRHTARIVMLDPAGAVNPEIREIVGGGPILVEHGVAAALTNHFASVRNPRTAVGLNRAGDKMLWLVVDGRQPGWSAGMTLPELAREMIRLGCAPALNLDGGGSSALVYRNPATGRLEVLNSPSDTKERPVADVLKAALPEPRPPWPAGGPAKDVTGATGGP